MRKELTYALFVLVVLICLGFNTVCIPEDTAQATEKALSLTGIFRTSYALAGDLAGVKNREEAIYIAKGNINRALATLKDIIIEGKRVTLTFSGRDQINIIVFRGVLEAHGKIEITKLVSKGDSFEVYAKYIDFPGLDIPSQPAAIIPLGKLPSGKYTVCLYVNNQLHKKAEFNVRRYLHI